MDVIYLNYWVAVFQALVGLLFAVPSAPLQDTPISGIPQNMYGFIKHCFVFLSYNSFFFFLFSFLLFDLALCLFPSENVFGDLIETYNQVKIKEYFLYWVSM